MMFNHDCVSSYEELTCMAMLLMDNPSEFRDILYDKNGELGRCVKKPQNFIALEKIFSLLSDEEVQKIADKIDDDYFNKFIPNHYLLNNFIAAFPKLTSVVKVKIYDKNSTDGKNVVTLKSLIDKMSTEIEKCSEMLVKPVPCVIPAELTNRKKSKRRGNEKLFVQDIDLDECFLSNAGNLNWHKKNLKEKLYIKYFIFYLSQENYTFLSRPSELLYSLEKSINIFPQVLPMTFLLNGVTDKAYLATLLIKAAVEDDNLSRHNTLYQFLTKLCDLYLLPFQASALTYVKGLIRALEKQKSPYAGLFQLFVVTSYHHSLLERSKA